MDRAVGTAGPLEGVVVLDFTQVELGPCATQTLGDFGADVIKIERPGSGDLAREHMRAPSGESAVFWSLNRNKRSVAIDIRSRLGREAILRLAQRADVLVHNFRPGVMERLGFAPDDLRTINPRLIYAIGSGYGPDGPYREKGGQDVLAQAISGVAARRPDPSAPPEPSSTAIADFTAGMLLVQGILLALIARERTGRGQVVHASLLDGMLAMQLQEASVWLNLRGNLNWGAFPLSGTFATRDGHVVMVGAFKANPLREICKGLGIEDLSADPRYATHDDQVAHREELQARFRREFARFTTAEAVAALEAVDILVSRINTLGEALEDPQVAVNRMVVEMRHPAYGAIRTVGIPVKLEGTPGSVRLAPPRLGEHTAEVLGEVGFSAEEIAELTGPAAGARTR
ncbi:MAG TPA: CaiB/BaiF CoA-transferase family protein [bacterium]|nr:CaiB/BaiF CoA-transferase family protein [bacterium]